MRHCPVKIATNFELYHKMMEEMDVNAGVILQVTSLEEVREEIVNMIIEVAPGKRTESETLDSGDEEFCPWDTGVVL